MINENNVDFTNTQVLLSPPDPRDYPVSAAADILGINIPKDFEVWQPPVENQGGAGNCVAQSLANIMECIAHEYGEEHKDYSVGYIFGNPRNTASDGMYPREACEILLKDGDVLRETWECLLGSGLCKTLWQTQVTEEIKAKARKVMAYVRIHTKKEMQAFMLKYKLPVMIIAQTDAFKAGMDGRHATVCYGWISKETWNKCPGKYNDLDEYGYEDLLFTNSWGIGHHNEGRGTCEFKNMEEIWGVIPMAKIKLTDIKGRWSETAIEKEVERGTIKGYEDGTFKPTQPITREEAAVMFDRSHTATEKKLMEIIKKLEAIERMI